MWSTERRDRRMQAKQQAENKMREAGQWWEATDLAIERCRQTEHILYLIETAIDACARAGVLDPCLYHRYTKASDATHDWLLVHRDNMEMASTCAVSCEIAARIYYEEYEERHG